MKNKILRMSLISLLLCLCNLILENNVKGQISYLGIKGGLNLPNLEGGTNAVSEGYKTRQAPAFGIFGGMNLTQNLDLQIELLYSGQGGIKNWENELTSAYNSQIPKGLILYQNTKNIAILNYIELPILAKYNLALGKTFKFHIEAGPYFGYLISAKTITSSSSPVYFNESETKIASSSSEASYKVDSNVTSSIRKGNFGITGGLAFSMQIGQGELILDGRPSYGFTNIQKYAVDGKNRTGEMVISLGYAMNLKSKKLKVKS